MSYNNQLMYRPDYAYAESLLKVNPFKNIVEPFEKMDAQKAAAAKASLDGKKTLSDIAKISADIDKTKEETSVIAPKAKADIEKNNSERLKIDEEKNFIAPKANAEIGLKYAQANQANANTDKIKTQSGLLVPAFLLSKEYKEKQMKKMQNDMENSDIRTAQSGLRNLMYGSYLEKQTKNKTKDNFFGEE